MSTKQGAHRLPDTCLELPTQHVMQTQTHSHAVRHVLTHTHTCAHVYALLAAPQHFSDPTFRRLSKTPGSSPKTPSRQVYRDTSSLEVRSKANPYKSLTQDMFSAQTHTELGSQSSLLLPLYPVSCREAGGREPPSLEPRPYFHLSLLFQAGFPFHPLQPFPDSVSP